MKDTNPSGKKAIFEAKVAMRLDQFRLRSSPVIAGLLTTHRDEPDHVKWAIVLDAFPGKFQYHRFKVWKDEARRQIDGVSSVDRKAVEAAGQGQLFDAKSKEAEAKRTPIDEAMAYTGEF